MRILGQVGSHSRKEVEILKLINSTSYHDKASWCIANIPEVGDETSAFGKVDFPARDGAVVAYINSRAWVAEKENVSVPARLLVDNVLVCGGADTSYHVTDTCVWYTPGAGTRGPHVTGGPRMSVARYQASVITRPGLVWSLGLTSTFHHWVVASLFPGGRDGSYLHASTELLYQPGHYTLAGGRELELDRWTWAHQGMLNTRVWREVVPPGMKSLPLPLSGHCLVDIRDRSSEGGCTLLFLQFSFSLLKN